MGALDGTYIDVTVPKENRARYRNRKGRTTINVLAACNKDMKFIYVLSGWEGSAADSRVLRDAITRPNGFQVPRGILYNYIDVNYIINFHLVMLTCKCYRKLLFV